MTTDIEIDGLIATINTASRQLQTYLDEQLKPLKLTSSNYYFMPFMHKGMHGGSGSMGGCGNNTQQNSNNTEKPRKKVN